MITVSQQAPDILRTAAEALEALPHPRVNCVDLHLALRDASPTYGAAQEALNALAAYMVAHGGDERWLHSWMTARGRDEVAAELRAAAEHVETPAAVA